MKINQKSKRTLELYNMFLEGKVVYKQERAVHFQVNPRSIQRDIETIRAFLEEQLVQRGIEQDIVYDRKINGYRLITKEKTGD